MKYVFFWSAALPVVVCLPSFISAEPLKGELDPLILLGRGDWGERHVQLDTKRHNATDGASMLDGALGVAIVRNGGQTGIVQMRGLSGDRVKILVDGMSISPACPNHMDPPMHYVCAGSDTELTYTPGVTPVRYGGDSLSGTVNTKRSVPL